MNSFKASFDLGQGWPRESNGIDATSGAYWNPLPDPQDLGRRIRDRLSTASAAFPGPAGGGTKGGLGFETMSVPGGGFRVARRRIDPRRLPESGWGAILPYDLPTAVREALAPLFEHRRTQVGDGRRFRIFERVQGLRPGESSVDFLERQGAAPGAADPRWMPYYLLLVGDSRAIPFDFQYDLGFQYAVGRLALDSPGAYGAYAKSVLAAETGALAAETGALTGETAKEGPCRVALFAVAHDSEPATESTRDELVRPLANSLAHSSRAFAVGDVAIEMRTGEDCRKGRMIDHLGGEKTPDLLFASCHGLVFPPGDPRQRAHQGALLCDEFPGPALRQPPTPDQYLCAEDIAETAPPAGLIAFLHGCFSAGTPRTEGFARRDLRTPRELAPEAFVARLPQRLLGHPKGGALAVIGHVDQTWTSSFLWRSVGSRIQMFEDALGALLDGEPVGLAMEAFAHRHGELASHLIAQTILDPGDTLRLASLWTACFDARSFIVLGDPAVRLRGASSRAFSSRAFS